MRSRRRGVEEQRREVEAWRASKLTAAVFAARRGFSQKSLFRWAALESERPSALHAQFVRLEVSPRRQETAELVVEVGSARVRVVSGFDAQLLREVVVALAGATS